MLIQPQWKQTIHIYLLTMINNCIYHMLAFICGGYHLWGKFLIYRNVRQIHNSIKKKLAVIHLQQHNQTKRFETCTKYFNYTQIVTMKLQAQ